MGRGIRGRQERQDKEDSVEPLVHPVFPDNQEALSGREFMELLEQLDPSAFQDQQVIINIVIIIIILFARIQVNTAVKLYRYEQDIQGTDTYVKVCAYVMSWPMPRYCS